LLRARQHEGNSKQADVKEQLKRNSSLEFNEFFSSSKSMLFQLQNHLLSPVSQPASQCAVKEEKLASEEERRSEKANAATCFPFVVQFAVQKSKAFSLLLHKRNDLQLLAL